MNTSPQITSVEETIRIPAWRRASPANRNTRRLNTSRTHAAANLTIRPALTSHPRGAGQASRSEWRAVAVGAVTWRSS